MLPMTDITDGTLSGPFARVKGLSLAVCLGLLSASKSSTMYVSHVLSRAKSKGIEICLGIPRQVIGGGCFFLSA